ncbi:NAD-dependent protein deacylase [Halobacillus karajensis]|uniref:protein acetyllysine N-acetyltransferase n=1 Tax=Halobacillus karajensis TaxID=195088 RepID=A0A024P345_9BACI|nr:NAD-dependent protein deacylase [Halobacillus karajensis]CDQ19988.1 NAD-dependent protein deacetylase [Halobacillus karajensis]CDQ22448.1 NAD-dependent protein deacetylase [Halobacillus karajensis]CDQ28291.1 NAD-dependent protein deacetylase [Halobacillus karajensis]
MYETIALNMKCADNIAVLTGAGVSTASGIPDFRSTEGLWTEDHAREYYMSSDYFFHDPEDFWKKYKAIFRMKLLKDYQPNLVHQFIKDLETDEREVSVVTQNVDGLHSLAGSSRVLEYHGTLNKSSCLNCGRSYSLDEVMKVNVPECDHCGEILKPDVLLFGDLITAHEEAEAIIEKADLLLVMGTSLLVTPFNLLPYLAFEQNGTTSVIINNEPTEKDPLFDYVVHEDLTIAVEQLKSRGL